MGINWSFCDVAEIEACNLVSRERTGVNVTVQYPVPRDLQLSLLTSPDLQPTCVPGDLQVEDGKRTLSVFCGVPTQFQATVAIGYDILFDWLFSDDNTEISYKPVDKNCTGRECTTSVQVGQKAV